MSGIKVEVRTYRLDATIEFRYDPEKVDPFYFDDNGTRRWRMDGIYTQITTEAGMWKHLAWNALVNGVTDASSLDGWGDLEWGQLIIDMPRAEMEIEDES